MVDLRLTEEQAKWLRRHLDQLIHDGKWDSGSLGKNPEAMEHAETIREKLKKEEEYQKW